jgi:hydrogenase maturation protein HypF
MDRRLDSFPLLLRRLVQLALKLESIAKTNDLRIPPSYTTQNGRLCLDTMESLRQLLDLKKKGASVTDLAYAAQWHIGESLAEIACRVSDDFETKYVGFSGGVALNRIITKAVDVYVSDYGLCPLIHKEIPPGDGGVSIGQAAIAGSHL